MRTQNGGEEVKGGGQTWKTVGARGKGGTINIVRVNTAHVRLSGFSDAPHELKSKGGGSGVEGLF